MADFGNIARSVDVAFRRPVYFFAPFDGPPDTRKLDPALVKITGTPDYPEHYWRRPLILERSRGLLNFTAGADALFRPAPETTTAQDPDGWRWNQPFAQQFRYQVSPGTNRVTLTVKHNRAQAPTPQVRILARPTLGVTAQLAAASTAVGTWQTLVLEFNADRSGFVPLVLEWALISPGQQCVWQGITLQP